MNLLRFDTWLFAFLFPAIVEWNLRNCSWRCLYAIALISMLLYVKRPLRFIFSIRHWDVFSTRFLLAYASLWTLICTLAIPFHPILYSYISLYFIYFYHQTLCEGYREMYGGDEAGSTKLTSTLHAITLDSFEWQSERASHGSQTYSMKCDETVATKIMVLSIVAKDKRKIRAFTSVLDDFDLFLGYLCWYIYIKVDVPNMPRSSQTL